MRRGEIMEGLKRKQKLIGSMLAESHIIQLDKKQEDVKKICYLKNEENVILNTRKSWVVKIIPKVFHGDSS